MSEFFIYYQPNCAFCENAKKLISARGDKWSGLDITKHPENLEEFRSDFPGAKTVPQIIDITDGDYLKIGTFDDLVRYYGY